MGDDGAGRWDAKRWYRWVVDVAEVAEVAAAMAGGVEVSVLGCVCLAAQARREEARTCVGVQRGVPMS